MIKKLLIILTAVVLVLLCGCKLKDDEISYVRRNKNSSSESTSEGVSSGDTVSDSSSADKETPYEFDRIKLTIPAGFVYSENLSETAGGDVFIPKDYPTHSDNINISKSTGDSLDNCTRELFETTLSMMLGNSFTGLSRYEVTKIGGKDTVIVGYEASMQDVDMEITQYMIFDSTFTDTVTFTSVTGDYDTAFDMTARSITLK